MKTFLFLSLLFVGIPIVYIPSAKLADENETIFPWTIPQNEELNTQLSQVDQSDDDSPIVPPN
ncbi:exported hypothetical protein [Planktothrix serta PCC 8927]|uniref:Uncharacterized protein n=1 Tax=Planktothrix serta PCC 8927 TaxID=671068 RepID=A0A7Z9E173_9CYAN|nr:hypothetical protein [Planktothrix serta]VXD17632.1 exported hypothetical protein [Planktothrix serta PCC 8927]